MLFWEGPLLADFVQKVGGWPWGEIIAFSERRRHSVLILAQAGTGSNEVPGTSFASFLRFWTVAARRNSSFAP